MLKSITLQNFKCFESLELDCAPLTLLSGLNSSGKSSILQALLMLRQSFQSGELGRGRLTLNGDIVELGADHELIFEDATAKAIVFLLQLDDDVLGKFSPAKKPIKLHMVFDYRESGGNGQLEWRRTSGDDAPKIELQTWGKFPPLGGELNFVNAERIGPRKFYNKSKPLPRGCTLDPRGEYAFAFLHQQQNRFLKTEDPRVPSSHRGRMMAIVDHWLQAITPNVHLQLETTQDDETILAEFWFDRPGDIRSQPYRATNVGFGLSYTLPVVMALLAPPSSLCLIENPEAHLHPQGQTRLAELAVRASLAGVQVIAETHSDHFIDGVRIAVRDGLIQPDDVAIHYFERDGGKTVVTSPQLDPDGRLSSWPAGFFDQHEENLARLLAPKS